MKEKIIETLSHNKNKALYIEQIKDLLNLNSVEEYRELSLVLNQMSTDGEIYLSNKGKYLLYDNSGFLSGKIIIKEQGYGFVVIDGEYEDVYVNGKNTNGAITNDIVMIEIIDKGKNEGRVIKVLKRDTDVIIGEVYTKDNKFYVKSKNNKKDILIPLELMHNAVVDNIVVVKPNGEINNNHYFGEVIDVLGHKNDPGVDILSYVYEYGFNPKFSNETEEELNDIPSTVSEEEMRGRVDLRDQMIFTIDGDDTKDIDDAISIKKLDNGHYVLGVHIADVSNYVKKGSPLDRDAYMRATSVYLVDRVVPMLPHKLSNGICSLNPNQDRLAFSCVMEIDNKGHVVSHDIYKSVIRSRKQMTYKCVNKILEEGIVPEGYEEFKDTLLLMDELSGILRKMKIERGYIEFSSSEPKILVDENGLPTEIVLRYQGRGENLIEDFMIAANETVSEHIFYQDLPSIYRVHDKPDAKRWRMFLDFIATCGYTITGKKTKDVSPKFLQSIMLQLKDKENAKVLNDLAIRSQAKAIYSEINIGHFGLGSKCYAHFTSPIRRYPDLTLHRILTDYASSDIKGAITYWENNLKEICQHCSEKEQDSVDCERDVEKLKKCEYMESHINQEYYGVISGVQEFGFFVELDNTVEGLVRVDSLAGDHYTYDKEAYCLRGRKSKNIYKFGDVVKVKVINASKDKMIVDFEVLGKEGCKDEKKTKIKKTKNYH